MQQVTAERVILRVIRTVISYVDSNTGKIKAVCTTSFVPWTWHSFYLHPLEGSRDFLIHSPFLSFPMGQVQTIRRMKELNQPYGLAKPGYYSLGSFRGV